jgi:antitoxin PrlF
LKSGKKLEVSFAQDNSIILQRKRAQPTSALHGMLAKPIKALTVEQMNQLLAAWLRHNIKPSSAKPQARFRCQFSR